ncbi:MAG: T9SS type A sorting domain-containing protein [Candidatus Eisenbacteria bacterium]|nr:T9SS type A sorting domain-containing protein [Candidatus Eisenbacteria bacterium]
MRLGRPGIFVLVTVLALTTAVQAATLNARLTFSESDVRIEELADGDGVRLRGAYVSGVEGEPELPVEYVRFVLPPGTTATGVRTDVLSTVELDGTFSVRARQPEVPLSRPEAATRVARNDLVYSLETLYPARSAVLADVGFMSGSTVATVAVRPVRYVPAEGRLVLHTAMEIELETTRSRATGRTPRSLTERSRNVLTDRLAALVTNPSDAEVPAAADLRSQPVSYLIITGGSYASTFQELADWKTMKGVPAEVVTTSDIYATYPGVDNQEKIRNCIIDYYQNDGTIYVLLAGDTNVVPTRVAWAMNSGVGGGPDEDDLHCDLYYADLDGTWNEDGDNKWGEKADDNVDMYADIFVGRAPVNTSTEASRFVDKILTYEGAPGGDPLPTDYQNDMLFLAEVLWSEPWTDHAICKNMIDDDSVPPEYDPITKLYQTSGNLSRGTAISALNDGYSIINHNGHAHYSVLSIGSSGLYRSDFDNLTNGDRQGVFYSMGCWSAALDYDCIAEHWVNSQGGGVAYIGNSRYGWGSPGSPGYGTGDVFDREFFYQLFNEGHDIIGVTHTLHKDAFVSEAQSDKYTRYTLYELNLLGDPEMRIWTAPPATAVAGHADELPLGPHPFVVTVSSNGRPVPGASVLLSNDEVYELAVTDAYGVAELTPAPASTGTADLVITGQGMLPYSSTVNITSGPPDTEAPGGIETLTLADPFDLGSTIEVDWTGYVGPSDLSHFRIYRETAPFTDVAGLTPLVSGVIDPSARTWSDAEAENGQVYYYAVTAVDHRDNESPIDESAGPIAATVNARILLWDADDGDLVFDGNGDDYGPSDGTEVPWIDALDAIGELYTYSTSLPADLSPYDLIIYLGGVINFGEPGANVKMTADEVSALTAFIDGGGSVYIEEPNFGGTYYANGTAEEIALWERFHATYTMGNGKATGNVSSLSGDTGTPTEGMAFAYDYQNWPDQFVAEVDADGTTSSARLWSDGGGLPRGAVYEDPATGSRRYMVPVVLGGLGDAAHPSTRLEYVTRILDEGGLIGTTGVPGAGAFVRNRLEQNAPNPFNPVTTVRFTVAREGSDVSLAVYDVAGRVIRVLAEGPHAAGEHAARWDGRDAAGRQCASGVYFYRLSVDEWTDSRRMVLLK